MPALIFHHVLVEGAADWRARRLIEDRSFKRGFRRAEREADVQWRRELIATIAREANPRRRAVLQSMLDEEHRVEVEARQAASDIRLAFEQAVRDRLADR